MFSDIFKSHNNQSDRNTMSSNIYLEKIEEMGPKLFEMNGSVVLWPTIIKTNNEKSVQTLFTIINGMNSSQKFDLAVNILKNGFNTVVKQFDKNNGNSSVDKAKDICDENQALNETQDEAVSDAIQSANEAPEEPQSNDDVISHENFFDAKSSQTESHSNSTASKRSYQTAVDSSQSESQENDTNVDNCESETVSNLSIITSRDDNSSKRLKTDSQLESQENPNPIFGKLSQNSVTSGLSGNILSLSSITSHNSDEMQIQTISPSTSASFKAINRLSPRMSSPKSSSLSPRSGDSLSQKSPQKIIEEYKSLVPYDSYCSESVYINNNESDSCNSVISFSELLMEKIIEENNK